MCYSPIHGEGLSWEEKTSDSSLPLPPIRPIRPHSKTGHWFPLISLPCRGRSSILSSSFPDSRSDGLFLFENKQHFDVNRDHKMQSKAAAVRIEKTADLELLPSLDRILLLVLQKTHDFYAARGKGVILDTFE